MHGIIEALASGADLEGLPPATNKNQSRELSREKQVSLMEDDNEDYAGMEGTKYVTPLMQAAKAGKAMAVALLLDAKASPFAKTRNGMQALHFAATVGCCDSCRYLISAGASPMARDNKERDAFACLPNYCVEVEYKEWAVILGLDDGEANHFATPALEPTPEQPDTSITQERAGDDTDVDALASLAIREKSDTGGTGERADTGGTGSNIVPL